MSLFSRDDYQHLFALGAELYDTSAISRRREIATMLMAMAESCIGPQAGWPCIAKRYRHLTAYDEPPA